MSIIYSIIAKSLDKVLCEFTEFQGNFEQVSRNLLKKVKSEHKATFSYDDAFYFHYLNKDNLTFMCMCDSKYSQEMAFIFLQNLHILFLETFNKNEIKNAISYSLNTKFRERLKEKIDYFNNSKNLEKIKNEYKSDLIQLESDQISIRSEKVNLIVKKSEDEKSHTSSLLEKTRIKRSEIRMKRLQNIFVFIMAIIILGLLISVIVCGGFDFENCRSE